MKHIPLFLVLIVIFSLKVCKAQEEQTNKSLKTYQKLELGYLFGGQVYNDNFSYNPGVQGQGIFGFHISKRFNAGLGVGYYQLTKERFLPIFAEVNGYTKGNKRVSNVITMQLGYAPGWYKQQVGYGGYNYNGGIYFDTGLGLQIKLSELISGYFRLSYRHQFAKISYELFQGTEYSETLNYDMLNIAFGIRLSN